MAQMLAGPSRGLYNKAMELRVKFFSLLREISGQSEFQINFQGRTAGELWAQLEEQYPALRPLRACRAIAVNRQYVKDDHPLQEGDEIAFFPPVSGG